ncbi:hypothetical protein HK104_002959 [Borealophlyctis nickersoniae]|nr:hypothetical protein HK104_002959 [Borealophlyctis nickersoniae]
MLIALDAMGEQYWKRITSSVENVRRPKTTAKKTGAQVAKEEQERERVLSDMTERQRRSYLRKLERGDGEGAAKVAAAAAAKGGDGWSDFDDSEDDEEEEDDGDDDE